MLRCHHVMCSFFQYSGYDYVCYPTYLGLYKARRVPVEREIINMYDVFQI